MSTMTVREMIHALRSNCREGILNSAIMASAGTGKTYQLAMRYIGLLLLGVEPEEIVAITFSKKAAGEIFEKIITQLIELIESEQKRLEAVRNGFLPANTTTEANLSGTLKKILASRRKLHIETNDSFLMQIIQGAPAEFGIAGEISMQDEEDDTLRQHAMLQALHSPMLSAHAKESREELYRILKSISFGLDKTTLYAEITELLKEYYPVYQDHPEEANWDMCDQPSAQALLGIESLKQIRESLEAALQKDHPEIIEVKPLEQKILDLMTNAELSAAGSGMRPEVDEATFFIDKGFLATPLPNSLSYYKKSYPVTPQLAEILHRLLSHIAAAELFAKQAKTHAVFQLMRLFQKTYDEQTQRAGKLVFSDILYLVNHLNQKDFGAAQVLQKRLDQKINHYLLDEFQDTSTNQWSAFQNLVEEVIQNMDPEVFRSFFMVGDIKQSIYQWRSGNPLQFRQICEQYQFFPNERIHPGPAPDPLILPEMLEAKTDLPGGFDPLFEIHGILTSLTRSFRSASPVQNAVNDVFLPDGHFQFPDRLKKATQEFSKQRRAMGFQRHVSALKDHPERGFAVLLQMPKRNSDDAVAQEEQTYRLICELIRELDPFSEKRKKPLSIAVLFRQNKHVLECYETMKILAPEIRVSMEGKLMLKQSMCCSVFRQILRFAAHPGDQTAPAFLGMLRTDAFPGGLAAMKQAFYPGKEGSFPQLIRAEIGRNGFAPLLDHFCRVFPNAVSMEEEYVRLLRQCLIRYDQGNERDPDELVRQLDRCQGKQRSESKSVQLMTIHQSKGLGFDVVILPDEKSVPGRQDPFVVNETYNRLYFQPAKGIQDTAPISAAWNAVQSEKDCYETCCNLYVAMTRAKRGLYMFVPEENEKGTAATMHTHDILRATLSFKNPDDGKTLAASMTAPKADGLIAPDDVLYQNGDPDWYKIANEPEEINSETQTETVKAVLAEKRFRIQLPPAGKILVRTKPKTEMKTPSETHIPDDAASTRFSSAHSADLGTQIHAIMEQCEWLETQEDVEKLLAPCSDQPEAAAIVRNALHQPEIFSALQTKDHEHTQLWREKAFLTKIGPTCINGIIDRAVIRYGNDGQPGSAEIIDYKTDQLAREEDFQERYRKQLELYRRAMSVFTGLPENKITCMILALRPGLVIRW